MTKTREDKIEELILKIKSKWGDWEVVHFYYDEILKIVARKHEPKLMRRLNRLLKDATLWYA